ncbi:MAG: hypothetical protein JOY54_11090 [Acidobacteriaceae bacterium]|nr:hypothetical protein [Acidobacteriaceae bacterium]
MAQLVEPEACYHELLQQEPYRDLAWAGELQSRMRQERLSDSGRPLVPVLRPCFVRPTQLRSLQRTAEQLTDVIGRIQNLVVESPVLLNRLRLLPAEKVLAVLPPGYARSNVTSRLEAHVHNGSLALHGIDACRNAGLAHAEALANLFLNLPIMKDFARGRYNVSKLGGLKELSAALLETWKEFGGKHAPSVAIIEPAQQLSYDSSEGHLLAELLSCQGFAARLVSPDQLEYTNGRLRCGDFEIDIALRRLLTRELLLRSDLSHPLLRAYQDHAVCLINSFRSELALRRSLFDLLTDESVTTSLPAADRSLLRSFVPWTRVVSARKTTYRDEVIDLPQFVLRCRRQLVLLPNEDDGGHRPFVGRDLTPAAWERALQLALRESYVVQECSTTRQVFPFFYYGELQMKSAEVSVCPQMINGRIHGAYATLHSSSGGSAAPLGLAPVLLLEEKSR